MSQFCRRRCIPSHLTCHCVNNEHGWLVEKTNILVSNQSGLKTWRAGLPAGFRRALATFHLVQLKDQLKRPVYQSFKFFQQGV